MWQKRQINSTNCCHYPWMLCWWESVLRTVGSLCCWGIWRGNANTQHYRLCLRQRDVGQPRGAPQHCEGHIWARWGRTDSLNNCFSLWFEKCECLPKWLTFDELHHFNVIRMCNKSPVDLKQSNGTVTKTKTHNAAFTTVHNQSTEQEL